MEKTNCVFILEDDPEFTSILKERLEKVGIKTLSAAEVSRASVMVGNQKFDCIMSDLRVGSKSGKSFIQLIRKNPHHLNHTTPIVLMSGSLETDLLKSLGPNISCAFVKPFELAAFVSKVQALCGIVPAAS